jgi:hypothetical protein
MPPLPPHLNSRLQLCGCDFSHPADIFTNSATTSLAPLPSVPLMEIHTVLLTRVTEPDTLYGGPFGSGSESYGLQVKTEKNKY